jgi:hypothetical protein
LAVVAAAFGFLLDFPDAIAEAAIGFEFLPEPGEPKVSGTFVATYSLHIVCPIGS